MTSEISEGSDTTGLLDNGMPLKGYGVRKILTDRDVAIGYCPLFLVPDAERPRVPWVLWGFTISNMAVACIMAAINHSDMLLGFS